MRNLRRNRALIGWFGVIAMLCNLTAAMLCSVRGVQAASAERGALPTLMVICSEHGTMTVPADDGAPAPEKPCLFCVVAGSLALAIVFALFSALLLPAARLGLPNVLPQSPVDALRRAGLGSRAPPRFA